MEHMCANVVWLFVSRCCRAQSVGPHDGALTALCDAQTCVNRESTCVLTREADPHTPVRQRQLSSEWVRESFLEEALAGGKGLHRAGEHV